MIGSFFTRGLVMVFGYVYPAYECYKTVELNKPQIEQLRFWCQYWILVAVLTAFERVGDTFISWVPMYCEAKLLFYIYLWHPKTKGTTYVYDSFFRPYIAKHENEIDRSLMELKTSAGDMAFLYWQRAASYGQTRVFDILQFVAAQSTPRPRPTQTQQEGTKAQQPPPSPKRQPSTPKHQPSTPIRQRAPTQPETEEPKSPSSSASSIPQKSNAAEDAGPSQSSESVPPVVASNASKTNVVSEPSTQSTASKTEVLLIEAAPSSLENEKEKANPPPTPKEAVMEETTGVTRGRLRKTKSGGGKP